SRSENTPTSASPSSTGMQPMRASLISAATSKTVAVGAAWMTWSRWITCRRVCIDPSCARATRRARACYLRRSLSIEPRNSREGNRFSDRQLPRGIGQRRRGPGLRDRAAERPRDHPQVHAGVLARAVALEHGAPFGDRLLAAAERVEGEAGLDRCVEQIGVRAPHARELGEGAVGEARLAQRDPEPVADVVEGRAA